METVKMSIKKALLAATVLTLPAAVATAQPVTGPYIGLGAGANWVNNPERLNVDGDIRGNLLNLPPGARFDNAGKINFELGWTGVVSLGWGFGNGLRAEVEGNFRENEVDSIRGLGLAPIGRTGGFQRQYGVMGNVFYDFDPGFLGIGPSYVQPYVGVGAGYAWTDLPQHPRRQRRPGVAGLQVYSNDTDSGRFAYQGIAGVAVPFTWLGVPGLTLTAEYRFLGMLEPEMRVTVRDAGNRVVGGGKTDVEKYNHSVMLGLRYALFQPARRLRRSPPRCSPWPRRRRRPAPTSCSSTSTGPTSRRAPGRSSPRRRRTRAGCSPRASRWRPRRPLGHAAVQPAPVAAARRGGGLRAGGPRRGPQRDRRERLRREPAAGAHRRRRARARRTAASRSCCARPFRSQRNGVEHGWPGGGSGGGRVPFRPASSVAPGSKAPRFREGRPHPLAAPPP
jgi:opacity protein-like surface antigen